MQPSQYICDHLVKIGLCPEFTSNILPDKPAYWYLFIPSYAASIPYLGISKAYLKSIDKNVFQVFFWSGAEWWHTTPKQFATAEEAYAEWETIIKPNYLNLSL